MFQKTKLSSSLQSVTSTTLSRSAAAVAGVLFSVSVAAQQSGSIEGKVYLDDNVEAAGVTITATSSVMPRSRSVETDEDGEFRMPALIPGTYTLTLTTENGITRTVKTKVLLDQNSTISVMMAPDSEAMEEVAVVGQQVVLGGDSSVSNALGADVVKGIPTGNNYRDMMKLIPGVQFHQNAVRGANAGGSGQDNVYAFDGVNITLPMFGTLSAEPSNHDIEMVTVERGGATAIGFNRSGGFSVDSKSKSGTNEFQAGFEHKLMPKELVAKNKDGVEFEQDQSWTTVYASGPVVEDQLFFYGSYFGPTKAQEDRENAYGSVKDYSSDRSEYFAKLTWAPTDNILINGSYRTSDREDRGQSVGEYETDSVSYGTDSGMKIATLDGSWVVNDRTTVTAQLTSYAQESTDKPDVLAEFVPSLSTGLDVDNLVGMGYVNVPGIGDDPTYNAFVQPFIDQYGYINSAGERVGTGGTGVYSGFWEQNFYRDSFEIALEHNLDWGSTSHEIHVGFQWEEGEEELISRSNGWGGITVPGGLVALEDDGIDPGDLIFLSGVEDLSFAPYFQAVVRQTTLDNETGFVDPINSYTESLNFEVNDKIDWNDFTFNVGFLISQDRLFGEGLKKNGANYSGYELAEGNKYEMYKVDWKDMIQPRLGVTWRYNDAQDTIFANYARYNPAASSLARAASWARNAHPTLNVYFDEQGEAVAYQPRKGSSGKVFQKDMDPRFMDEITIGTTRSVTDGFNLRAHVRYRENENFWEDTPYYTPSGWYFNMPENIPEEVAAQEYYAYSYEEMVDIRSEIGGGSYVIAQIDGAYTKYWEASLEAEWIGDRTYLNASYVRSRYSGNFDQDNTSSSNNDQALFLGSSSLMDWETLNIWDNREGTLTGDRPHIFKTYGYYNTDWNANIGAYLIYQSGHAWQIMDGTVYGYSPTLSNDGGAYGEKAGSRRTPAHWQLDLSYTQNFQVFDDYTLKFRADLFNVFDRQTGYDPEQRVRSSSFMDYRRNYESRRAQLSFGVDF
ncbi:TonB-dependent receptor [Microbulbifer salipaludis]|uniref:TonB-dependent receptor n=1 Tax=Microbulbifer salipaludis TaxID=187980 RepID=A0ABS3E9K6_9GAMM|nr:TonB-dependent receptor [Microbulbifer salipaludis]MBN8431993.1 TonB-dependent receptor [Microbulbifer salipaludis]